MASALRHASQILIFLALPLLWSYSAHAQIQVDSATGASNFIKPTVATDNTSSNAIVYGGIAGSATAGSCASTSGTDTCNNCASDMNACNTRRIYPNLKLRISFTVTGDNITGTARMWYSNGGTITQLDFNGSAGTLTKGSTAYVEATWAEICDKLGAGSGCDTPVTDGVLYVGISTSDTATSGQYATVTTKIFAPADATNGINDITCDLSPQQDGICNFTAYPGDQKIYLEDLNDQGSYPSADTVPFKFLRVYFTDDSTNAFNAINYGSQDYADLDIDSDGAITPEKIDGLENGVQYFFKTAMVDAAYNVAYMTSDTQIIADCTSVTAPSATCPMSATPSEVFGLLEKDFNCFISTAAYGSLMYPKVQDFRNFRNKFLIPYDLGRKFIFSYYNHGPKAARWMWEHPWSRPVVRAALWPVWLYAVIANSAGLFVANFTFFLMFALVAYSIYVLRTRKQPVKVRRGK